MNLLKKSLFALLALFLSAEYSIAQPRKLRSKLQRPGQQITRVPQSTHKEIAEVFTTDDQKKIAQEVKDINTQTRQEKQNVKVALQQEVIKEIADIKVDLIEAQADQPQYITYNQTRKIIKSKKELANMKRSSWTKSLIIKPFTKTYRLFLRVWNQKEYTALLEKERKSLEHALNVQAYNNLMLLYVALDLEVGGKNTDMFKKDNFYNITTRAFEGGAILATEITLSEKLLFILSSLDRLIKEHFTQLSKNPAIVQSIWEMNEVLWETQHPREGWKIKRGLEKDVHYDYFGIKELCQKAAEINGQVLHEKKSYAQYLKDWISQPKNVVKTGMVMAAIGGLYLYGPATPSWLKEYANSSIGSAKDAISRGYNTTISSVKNLWNRVRGNTELPDSRNARMDAQEQALETDEDFLRKGKHDASDIEEKKELAIGQAEAFFEDEFDQQYNE